MDIAFLAMMFPLKGETRLFIYFFCIFEKNHFEKGFEVATYFIIFLRENKIRKKTLNETPNRKNKYMKTESRLPIEKVRRKAVTPL